MDILLQLYVEGHKDGQIGVKMSNRILITHTLPELAARVGKPAPDFVTRRILARSTDLMVMQASLPPNTEIPPHDLPSGRPAILTLVRGQLEIGLGKEYDHAQLTVVEQGGMAVFRPDDPVHFARTGPDGAEIFVVSYPSEASMPVMNDILALHPPA